MKDIARRLAPLEIGTETGESVILGTAWATRPVLLVFIRHFG